MQNDSYNIAGLLLATTLLIMLMAVFILVIIFQYRKKQMAYQEKLNAIRADNETNILKSQLEMQEQTSQHISREIHDNISLSLTLAKLHLNTLDWKEREKSREKVDTSIELITQSIAGLSDISKGLNADIIIQHGLLKVTEDEMLRIRKAGLFHLDVEITGTPVYMDNQKELIIFRIIQEAFNNIIKHAGAANAKLVLHYEPEKLVIIISDDGKGFNTERAGNNQGAGLKNMAARIKTLHGNMHISSLPGNGTALSFNIPFE